jgi:hypothetical protein
MNRENYTKDMKSHYKKSQVNLILKMKLYIIV